jgi:hypothetical protein
VYKGPARPALAALDEVLRQVRELIAARFADLAAAGQDPAAVFSGKPYVLRANQRDGTTYRIERPSDGPAFILQAIVTNAGVTAQERQVEVLEVASDIGLDADATAILAGVYDAFAAALFGTLYDQGPAAVDAAIQALAAPGP